MYWIIYYFNRLIIRLLVVALEDSDILGYIFENKVDYDYDYDFEFGFLSFSGFFELFLTTLVSFIGFCLCIGARASIRVNIGNSRQ